MKERGMRAVELLDEPDLALDNGHGDDRAVLAAPAGKLRWWLARGAALLVVVLGATQWAIGAHERAIIAQLAAVEGVVPEVDGPLDVGQRYSQAASAALFGQSGGLTQAPDGSLTYQWGDGSADDPGWSKQLLGPLPAFAGAYSVNSASQCVPDVAVDADASTASRVVCLITDGGFKILDDNGEAEQVPATTTFIEVLDTAAGAPLAQWPAPDAKSFALVDGQIVVGAAGPDADVFTSRDPLTGDVRWTHEVPLSTDLPESDPMWRSVGVSRAGDLISVRTTSGELRLLSADDGHLVRDGLGGDGRSSWNWQADPSGRPYLESWDNTGNASVILLAPDADPAADRTLPGSIVPVEVDDGSVPGLLLTTDSALHAWDAQSGSPRWSSSSELPSTELGTAQLTALVVRGRVYLQSPAGLAALDGHTGKTMWRVEPDKGLLPTTLFTDAHHLLVGYERPARDGDPVVVAYDFAGGTEASRVAYPDGIDHLMVWEGKLIGYDEDYTNLAALS